MSKHYPQLLRELLHKVVFRYLDVTPSGLAEGPDATPLVQIEAQIVQHGPARTLYKRRRPACRSLNGIAALSSLDKVCASCPDRPRCTPQICLDLLHQSAPCRLLLAFTSAKNFLLYDARLRSAGMSVEDVLTRVRVVNRGSWGELRFDRVRPR